MLTPSKLERLLSSPSNGPAFKSAIEVSMPAFKRGLAERGRSAPVEIYNEGMPVVLENSHILHLCNWYLNGQIDAVELEYAANLIELSEDFRYSKEIDEIVFTLGGPEINGAISPTSVQTLLKLLGGAT